MKKKTNAPSVKSSDLKKGAFTSYAFKREVILVEKENEKTKEMETVEEIKTSVVEVEQGGISLYNFTPKTSIRMTSFLERSNSDGFYDPELFMSLWHDLFAGCEGRKADDFDASTMFAVAMKHYSTSKLAKMDEFFLS